jgi:hypothetical protein
LRKAERRVLLGSPEKLLDRFEENMDDFFPDKSRAKAYRNWFREGLHGPGLKVQNLDQGFDPEFVLSLFQPYM